MGINPLSPKLIWLGSEKCQSTFTLFIFITCWQQMESQTANSWITRHMKRLESRLPLYFQVNDSILTDSMEWENLHGDFHFWDCSKIHPRGFPHPHLHPHHPRGNHLPVLILTACHDMSWSRAGSRVPWAISARNEWTETLYPWSLSV